MATMTKSSRTTQTGSKRAVKERASLKQWGILGTSFSKYCRKPVDWISEIAEVSEPDPETGLIRIDLSGALSYKKADGSEQPVDWSVYLSLDPKTGILDLEEWNG
jgi:hypothetical protein